MATKPLRAKSSSGVRGRARKPATKEAAGCVGRSSAVSRRETPKATSRLPSAATPAVAVSPRAGIRATSGSSAPSTAPAVFRAYSAPMTRPRIPVRASARLITGSVPPIRVVGTSISPKKTANRTSVPTGPAAATRRASPANSGSPQRSSTLNNRPLTPIPTSSAR